MKVICEGTDLADAVLKVSKGTSTKTTNPILEGIKIVAEEDYITLSATDLELSIEKTIRGMVQIEGEMVVPGKFFCEYIKKLNNEQIELNVDEKNILSIKYTDSVGKIQCLNSAEFPQIKQLEDEKLVIHNNCFNEITQIEEWTGLEYDSVVFDSDICLHEIVKSTFNQHINNKKNLVFLMFCGYFNRHISGGFISTTIKTNDKDKVSIIDDKSFLFTFRNNIPNKYEIKIENNIKNLLIINA